MKVGDKLTKCKNAPLFITSVPRSSFRHIHFVTTFTFVSSQLPGLATFPFTTCIFLWFKWMWSYTIFEIRHGFQRIIHPRCGPILCRQCIYVFFNLFQNLQYYNTSTWIEASFWWYLGLKATFHWLLLSLVDFSVGVYVFHTAAHTYMLFLLCYTYVGDISP